MTRIQIIFYIKFLYLSLFQCLCNANAVSSANFLPDKPPCIFIKISRGIGMNIILYNSGKCICRRKVVPGMTPNDLENM